MHTEKPVIVLELSLFHAFFNSWTYVFDTTFINNLLNEGIDYFNKNPMKFTNKRTFTKTSCSYMGPLQVWQGHVLSFILYFVDFSYVSSCCIVTFLSDIYIWIRMEEIGFWLEKKVAGSLLESRWVKWLGPWLLTKTLDMQLLDKY